MRRETTNRIRFVLEELLPPAWRDSGFMRWLFRRHWGELIDDIERFRERGHWVTEDEYAAIYSALPRVHQGTDLNDACAQRLVEDCRGRRVLDVGCGTGVFLEQLRTGPKGQELELTGVDFQVDPSVRSRLPDMRFEECKIEQLPFADDSFDTVICTHVLEHILDIRAAVAELRRVAQRRLLIVVPREREYRFTFNPHLHFFAYPHSFLRHMLPVPRDIVCEDLGRDIYYREDLTDRDGLPQHVRSAQGVNQTG